MTTSTASFKPLLDLQPYTSYSMSDGSGSLAIGQVSPGSYLANYGTVRQK